MSDDLERLMSQLHTKGRVDASETSRMDKYNGSTWEASYKDTHGKLITSNPVAEKFPYFPKYTKKLGLKDQQGHVLED